MILRALATTLFAASLFAAEPEKLTKLRESYQAAISKATAPIQKTYTTELEKLKSEFTKVGDLESALAVDAELKVSAQRSNPTAAVNSDVEASTDLSWLIGKEIVSGSWSWEFLADQKVNKKNLGKPAGTYRYLVEADGRINVKNDIFLIKTKIRALHFTSPEDKEGSEARIVSSK